jgi:hypothetical protein
MATDYWLGTQNSNWSDGANWSLGVRPAPSDVVATTRTGSFQNSMNVDEAATIAGLNDDNPPVEIDVAHPLTVAGNFVIGNNPDPKFIDITSTLSISGGASAWNISGIAFGTGGVLNNTGTLSITTPLLGYYVFSGGGTVNNTGTIDLQAPGGDLMLDDGTTVNNQPGGTINLTGDSGISTVGGHTVGTIVNAGTFEKTGGTGTSTIATHFSSSGVVSAQEGTLSILHGGPDSSGTLAGGTWKAGALATLTLDGPITTLNATAVVQALASFPGLSSLSTIDPGGTLELDATTLNLTGNLVNSGTLDLGPGELAVSGSYTQQSTGTLEVGIGGTIAGSQLGQVVAAQANLSGHLDVSEFYGFQPSLGQAFPIVEAGALGGQFTAVDQAGVTGPLVFQPVSTSTRLTLVAEMRSTTSVTASANPSVFGQPVTFTATVAATPPNSGTPTGTVTFKDGSTTLAAATLSGGTARFTTSSLAPGSHPITVVYSGDGSLAPSSSTALGQTVGRDGTTTTVTSSVNPSVFGQAVTFTATVKAAAPGSGTPSGTVTFKDGATVLGTASLAGGKASLATNGLSIGSQSITVVYSGDPEFLASTSAVLTQTVGQDGTITSITSSANPSAFGQAVTFTATVKAAAPGSGTPSGTVTFKDGATVLGTASLAGGKASFVTSTLAVGTHSITAVYGGNADFKTSASPVLSMVVKSSSGAVPAPLTGAAASLVDTAIAALPNDAWGASVDDLAADRASVLSRRARGH